MDAKGLLIKGSIGLGGAGVIGFAGYQAVVNSKAETNNIQKRLEKEGYTPLTKNSGYFAAILSSYKTVTGTNENLKFAEFTGLDDTANNKKAEDILWEHCQKAFNNEPTDEVFNKARKWCVEPISITEILKKQGISALDAGVADESSQAAWNKKIEKYRKGVGIPEGFKNLILKGSDETITKEHRTAIKTKCNTTGAILNHAKDFESNLNIFRDWCTDKE